MIRMGNEANAALAYFAAIAAGYVAFLASAQLTFDEAAFLLQDSEAQALILGASFSHENHVSPGVAILSPQALDALFLSEPIADYKDTAAQDPAYLVYTSGTTSRPKGVLHAHRAAWGRRPMLTHWTGLRSEDVMLHAGAINWTYTLGVGVVDPLSVGAAAVLYNGKSDPSVWPRLIERYGVSVFAAVPGVFRQILKYGALEEYDLSSLRHGLSAGAALPQNLSLDWRKRTGKEIFEAFGMSEISTFISSGPLTPIKTDSPGRAQPGRVVAALPVESGDVPLGSGQTGLLAIRRDDPGMMLGYWKRQEEEKIPEIEEIEAVACAIQNLHLSCTAYGLGGFWSTPKVIYSEEMTSFLGLSSRDKCLGIFYVGYPDIEWPQAHRRPLEYNTTWISE